MKHTAAIYWNKIPEEEFLNGKYSRVHHWAFDGGVTLEASASPHIVPVPFSKESAIDPEEAFVASVASCHMLWFLSIAAAKRYVVEKYEDNAEGVLQKNSGGRLAMTDITLRPVVAFAGKNIPSQEMVKELHSAAHEKCFIAESVKTAIHIIHT